MSAWYPVIAQGAVAAWNWADSAGRSVGAVLLLAPSTCRESLIHTGFVCTGGSPHYYIIPGFAPFNLSWGWFLIGGVIGILFGAMVLPAFSKMDWAELKRALILPAPPISRGVDWREVAAEILKDNLLPQDQSELLQLLIDGGEDVLVNVAKTRRVKPATLLARTLVRLPRNNGGGNGAGPA